MKKQIEIKKEDIFNAFMEVAENDEETKKLFLKQPLFMFVVAALIVKIETQLFKENNSEEREEN